MVRGLAWCKDRKTHARVLILTWWYAYHRRAFSILLGITLVVAALLLFTRWAKLDVYLCSLENSVIPELAIGIGAAITGIIAIAFSLSLFAIQQVADRGTPATVQAYARDGVLVAIYWSLVTLAIACFAAALLKPAKTYHTVTVAICLVSLLISFALLNYHFRRVVKFADPRYTISRFYRRGEQQLKRLQMFRDLIVPKGRRK